MRQPNKKIYRVGKFDDPHAPSSRQKQCLAPHPKPSLRSGFDLSPRKSGERLGQRRLY
jgi:hypothetical protein